MLSAHPHQRTAQPPSVPALLCGPFRPIFHWCKADLRSAAAHARDVFRDGPCPTLRNFLTICNDGNEHREPGPSRRLHLIHPSDSLGSAGVYRTSQTMRKRLEISFASVPSKELEGSRTSATRSNDKFRSRSPEPLRNTSCANKWKGPSIRNSSSIDYAQS